MKLTRTQKRLLQALAQRKNEWVMAKQLATTNAELDALVGAGLLTRAALDWPGTADGDIGYAITAAGLAELGGT